ncbi:MAG TPA: HD domain-containing phosphohydrolase [Syntrophales bacterium]|nr:HD domain-containing phosphohydrolase [Syntrophales bacterium]
MVDLIHDHEALFLGLSTIQNYDDYTYTHSINVAVLSMCLGNRIGLSRAALCHLGLCGLFHDLGKVEVPLEIINKPGKLTDQEWGKIQEHPLLSVRQVLKLQTSHDLKSKIILAPFEHHLNYDLTGYPQIPSKKRVSLFGRILQIADFYDAISSPRIYRTYAYSRDQALDLMLERSGKEFDAVLLKVFINLMGIYPPGTLLLLDSGELGLAVSYPDRKERSRPSIMLLIENSQGGFSKGELVNLNEKDETSGRYKRNIVQCVHPETYGIEVASFIL